MTNDGCYAKLPTMDAIAVEDLSGHLSFHFSWECKRMHVCVLIYKWLRFYLKTSLIWYSYTTKFNPSYCHTIYRTNRIVLANLKNDLNTIASWCKTWQMPLNPSKCEVLYVFSINIHHQFLVRAHVVITICVYEFSL